MKTTERRIVLIYWKTNPVNPIEVFSNLKNLCISYPQYNYNTLNNYLSKDKIPYENEQVRIERKIVNSRPLVPVENQRRIVPVVVTKLLKDMNEKEQDLDYWYAQPAAERLSAVTFIISGSMKKGERMNKSIINKLKK